MSLDAAPVVLLLDGEDDAAEPVRGADDDPAASS
jgi:hypothetical protein